ncbi:MAG: RluA family pseudouridine synthase [Acidobacteriota bacterium]
MAETITLTVPEESRGTRLDTFLAERLAPVSRSRVRRWIEAGCVQVDGRTLKPGHALSGGQTVAVLPPRPEPSELIPEDLPLDILYEDDCMVVLNKQAGVVVHPGAGNWRGTLANALAFHWKSLSFEGSLRPGIVHRLDKGTSGVLLVAKNETSHEALAREFRERRVRKVYLALLHGRIRPPAGEIDLAIGRDRKVRTKISSRTDRPRSSVTRYELIRPFASFSLVRAFPVTGRTHQIRVHFHHLGYPVVGDPTYTRKGLSSRSGPVSRLERMFLHASSIAIRHPLTGETMEFEAPLPTVLEELIATLGE